MATSPPDNLYVTGDVPAEMRQGVELGPHDVAAPTAVSTDDTIDVDGVLTTLTRIRMPRPDNIPSASAIRYQIPPAPVASVSPPSGAAGLLTYDFPLLPGVQCHITFQGEVTADHLEQLLDYLGVACARLRKQQERSGGYKPPVALDIPPADDGSIVVMKKTKRFKMNPKESDNGGSPHDS